MGNNGFDFSNWYYRKCVIPNCNGSAHWEHICKDCNGYTCGIHFLPNPVQCVTCWEKQINEDHEKRKKGRQEEAKEKNRIRSEERKKEKLMEKIELQTRKQKTRQDRKLNKLALMEKRKEKLDLDIYFEISFFRKLNLHRIRRKKQ